MGPEFIDLLFLPFFKILIIAQGWFVHNSPSANQHNVKYSSPTRAYLVPQEMMGDI